MNCEALIRSGEGEFLPLTLPHSTNTRGGEFQMIHGGDFRVMFDRAGLGAALLPVSAEFSAVFPPLGVAALAFGIFQAFDPFGGGGKPSISWYDTTRKSRGAHPVYPFMGIQNVVDQSPSADNSAASDNPGRPLSDCEKCVLAPYIQKVDLDNARVHTNGLPTSGLASFAGLDPGVEAVTPPGGSDIYIRSGHYNPGTPRGARTART